MMEINQTWLSCYSLKISVFTYLILAAALYSTSKVSAQPSTNADIQQIKDYVRYVDSVDLIDDFPGGFSKSVEDGVITSEGKVIGGSGTYTSSNDRFDTVFRIEYHTNYPLNIYRIYYFMNNTLVYATLRLKDTSQELKTLYFKEEFYGDDQLIYRYPQKDPTHYVDISNLSLHREGKEKLLKFLAQKIR